MKKNKYLILGLVLASIVSVMSSCKKDIDLTSAFVDLANKKIDGTYSFFVVDSEHMVTTLHQYTLDRTTHKGSYAIKSFGDKVNTENTVSFTFSNQGLIEQNTFVNLLLTYTDGTTKNVKWGNNSIVDEGVTMPSSGDALSWMQALQPQWGNNDTWIRANVVPDNDTAAFYNVEILDLPYMHWTGTKTQKNLSLDSINTLKAYFDQQWVKDTIAWFNQEYRASVPDTIRYQETPAGSGKYTAVVPVYQIRYKKSEVKHFVGYEHIYQYTLYMNKEQDGHLAAWVQIDTLQNTRDVFDNPTAPTAIIYESHEQVKNATWCVSSIAYAKGFDLMLRGTHNVKVTRKEGGIVKTNIDETVSNYLWTKTVTDYKYNAEAKTGTMTCGGAKLKLVSE